MQIAIHAQLMANLCRPQYAELVLQVPKRHERTGDIQRQLISMLTHADHMGRICQTAEAEKLMYVVAEKLFNATRAGIYTIQADAARLIIGMISHASSMARIVAEGTDEIFATVSPIVEGRLPTSDAELQQVKARLDAARMEISNICHRLQMERLVRNINSRN